MTIDWPETLGFPDDWHDHADRIADSIRNDDATIPEELGLDVFDTGDGRVVYDISHITDIPAVLRVAHNDTGVLETRKEVHGRETIEDPLRNRLVPVYDHAGTYSWSVQPKCDSIPFSQRTDAVEALTVLVQEAKGLDTREVTRQNIGLYNDTPVFFDYGGILPQDQY